MTDKADLTEAADRFAALSPEDRQKLIESSLDAFAEAEAGPDPLQAEQWVIRQEQLRTRVGAWLRHWAPQLDGNHQALDALLSIVRSPVPVAYQRDAPATEEQSRSAAEVAPDDTPEAPAQSLEGFAELLKRPSTFVD